MYWDCCFSPLAGVPAEGLQGGILSIIQITTEEDIILITGITLMADTSKTTTTWVEMLRKTTKLQCHKTSKEAVELHAAAVHHAAVAAGVLLEVPPRVAVVHHAAVVHRVAAVHHAAVAAGVLLEVPPHVAAVPLAAVAVLHAAVVLRAVVVLLAAVAEEEAVAEEGNCRLLIQDST